MFGKDMEIKPMREICSIQSINKYRSSICSEEERHLR